MVRMLVGALILVACVAEAQTSRWEDFATFYSGSSQTRQIGWKDDNSPQGDYYEVMLTWSERPSRGVTKRFLASEVTRTGFDVWTPPLRMPGTGHFTVQIRTCWNDPAACTAWSSSTDPTRATVNGQPRAWWIYGYLEAPGGVVVPSSTPTGPEK